MPTASLRSGRRRISTGAWATSFLDGQRIGGRHRSKVHRLKTAKKKKGGDMCKDSSEGPKADG